MRVMNDLFKLTANELEDDWGMEVDEVTLKSRDDVKYIYVNESEDAAFVGCEYNDGTWSVVGCGMDCFCTYDEMISMVVNG